MFVFPPADDPAVVAVLVQKGADVHTQDEPATLLVMGARFQGYSNLKATLFEAGAEVNLRKF